jgi:precorrin-6Y C5,15-methyltransferase (decarboxylating)
VRRIVELAFDQLRPGGRLVANVGSIENLGSVREVLIAKAGDCNVLMVNLARGNDQLERLHFEAMHPTFLVSAVRK